jgi:hypothetical protein
MVFIRNLRQQGNELSHSFCFIYLIRVWICGGETGIRTLDTLRYTRFPSVRLQPLGHLSAVLRAFLNLTQSGITRETTD